MTVMFITFFGCINLHGIPFRSLRKRLICAVLPHILQIPLVHWWVKPVEHSTHRIARFDMFAGEY